MTNISHTPNKADLQTLAGRLESGDLKPAIEKVYPLAELPEAMAYFDQGHARGKLVITALPPHSG